MTVPIPSEEKTGSFGFYLKPGSSEQITMKGDMFKSGQRHTQGLARKNSIYEDSFDVNSHF